MSSRSFRSVFMVASCAGAALGCYLVSLRVASERAQLESVETKIVLAQRDMRVLQTEIGTRGRLSQLERWNAGAFALSAPAADQFLKGGFELARLAAPEHKPDFKAPVVLASAPVPVKRPPLAEPETDETGVPSNNLLHEASLKIETREVSARTAVAMPPTASKSTDDPATAAKPVHKKSAEKSNLVAAQRTGSADKNQALLKAALKPKLAAKKQPLETAASKPKVASRKLALEPASSKPKLATKKSVDKTQVVTAKALTKSVRIAKDDPLAPLPAHHSGHSKGIAAER